ncbi:hypothetical protein GW17_00032377 [Ensete ventricosum]|nr:hypothetical protein GW17_00032377 [Ensete ventricosum]
MRKYLLDNNKTKMREKSKGMLDKSNSLPNKRQFDVMVCFTTMRAIMTRGNSLVQPQKHQKQKREALIPRRIKPMEEDPTKRGVSYQDKTMHHILILVLCLDVAKLSSKAELTHSLAMHLGEKPQGLYLGRAYVLPSHAPRREDSRAAPRLSLHAI